MTDFSEWTPAVATNEIRVLAKSRSLTISYKSHARDRLSERGLIVSDILYVLKEGFIYDKPEPSTREGFNKYSVESRSPNSGRRLLRVIVIPDKKACFLKIISVMWADEIQARAGTIIGEKDE